MSNNLETVQNEVRQDLSSKWLTLSSQVRERAKSLQSRTVGTDLSSETDTLAIDAGELCDHFDRVHADVGKLLTLLQGGNLDYNESNSEMDSTSTHRQVLIAQENDHKENDSVKDVIKALFMWRDDPADIPVKKN